MAGINACLAPVGLLQQAAWVTAAAVALDSTFQPSWQLCWHMPAEYVTSLRGCDISHTTTRRCAQAAAESTGRCNMQYAWQSWQASDKQAG